SDQRKTTVVNGCFPSASAEEGRLVRRSSATGSEWTVDVLHVFWSNDGPVICPLWPNCGLHFATTMSSLSILKVSPKFSRRPSRTQVFKERARLHLLFILCNGRADRC